MLDRKLSAPLYYTKDAWDANPAQLKSMKIRKCQNNIITQKVKNNLQKNNWNYFKTL